MIIHFLCLAIVAANSAKTTKPDVLCGAECLYVALLKVEKVSVPFESFAKTLPPISERGFSLDALDKAAQQQGCVTKLTTLTILERSGLPDHSIAIVHQKPEHFQMLLEMRGGVASLMDTKSGYNQVLTQRLLDEYSETCLLISDREIILEAKSNFALLWIGALACGLIVCWFGGRRLVKKFAIAVILVLPMIGCNSPQGPPKIACSMAVIEKDAKVGVPFEVEFEIQNEGESDLLIDKLFSSCGCTSTSISKSLIPPKQSATIKATVSPSKNGVTRSTVTVVSNDLNASRFPLEIRWSIGDQVAFSMNRLELTLSRSLSTNSIGFTVRDKVELMSDLVSTFITDAPEYPSKLSEPPFNVKLQKGEHSSWTAVFELKDAQPTPGLYLGRISAVTKDGQELESIPWSVRVNAPIQFYPPKLALDREQATTEFIVESEIEGQVNLVLPDESTLECERFPAGANSTLFRFPTARLDGIDELRATIGNESCPLKIER